MKRNYDLIVAGGGFAGAAAALAAARGGASVLLVEQGNALGGSAVRALVNPFMPYTTTVDGQKKDLCQGIFREICARLLELAGPQRDRYIIDEEALKLLLNRMLLEAGAELLFRAQIIGAERDGSRLTGIRVFGQGRAHDLTARYFIDATGDANLTEMSGFPCRLGRESDHQCQPMTLCFRLCNVDMELFEENRPLMQEVYLRWKSEGRIKNPREDVLYFYTAIPGVIHFNTTRIIHRDPTDVFSVTQAEIEAREQVFEMVEMLRTIPCFRNSHLVSTAAETGIRESRMIDGEYVLTGNELLDCCRFGDSIAAGNYDIDIHNPDGTGTSHHYFSAGQYYTVPYRSLIPKGADNLLAAGRCISVDHEAQASIRIMPIVCCLGEAAGTAAALAAQDGLSVREVDTDRLRAKLIENGAVVD